MTLHHLLDFEYGPDAEAVLTRMLDDGADTEVRVGASSETALHVATRRRRLGAVKILVERGAAIDARTAGGKTAHTHAVRRGFSEIADLLCDQGAVEELSHADRLAVALAANRMEEARKILAAHPGVARTGNPEEDRLLADMAGRPDTAPVKLLIEAGADLEAPGLDEGTPLHQAAWFGQARQCTPSD